MKKILSMMIVSVLAFGMLVGCGANKTVAPTNAGANASKTDYPTKPITLIDSFTPGGSNDLGARVFASFLEKELGVPVVVENKTGGGGWVGYSEVAKAKPDGYTLGYLSTPSLITGHLNPTANIKESLDSFAYIANHVLDPGVFAIRADDKRFSTMQDVIDYAKKNEISASSNGVATGPHIMNLDVNSKFGTKIKSVQFSGTSEAVTAVLGGHIDILSVRVSEVLQGIKDGQLKALAVTTKERDVNLPNVPTFKEATGTELINYTVRGVGAPKGLDSQVLAKLRDASEKAMKNTEHVKKIKEMGLELTYMSGDDFGNSLKNEEKNILNYKSILGW